MNQEQSRPFIEAINSNFPDLVLESIEPAGEGMDNAAFFVNSNYIFRFPKIQEASDKTELEVTLLPELQKSLEVLIPSPEFVGTDPRTGFTFSGYRKIEGVPLEPEQLLDLEPEVGTILKEQIARSFDRYTHSR